MYAIAFGLSLVVAVGAAGAAGKAEAVESKAADAAKVARLEKSLEAGEWRRVGADAASVVFVKKADGTFDKPRLMVRFENLEPVWSGEISARSEVALYEVDCAGLAGRLMQSTAYSRNNLGGVARMQTFAAPVTDQGAPGSPFEAALREACPGAKGAMVAARDPAVTKASAAEPPRTSRLSRISARFSRLFAWRKHRDD